LKWMKFEDCPISLLVSCFMTLGKTAWESWIQGRMAWKRSQDRVFGAETGQFCVWTAELAHFASRVGHRSLLIGRQSSKIAHRSLLIGHQSSKDAHRALLIGHQSSKVAHRALLIAHRSIKLRDGVKLICDRPARKPGGTSAH
jgi:hypothetical protein